MASSVARAVADNGVYLGFWTNWSRGYILGATLTLNHRDGGLLTAFLALFVTLCGTSFWRIICYFLHLWLSSQEPEDGVYHQQQAILRNTADAISGAYRLFMTAWAWRGNAGRLYTRILPLLVVAVLLTSGFSVVSIFSSRISTLTGDEVLLIGDKCWLNPAVRNLTLEDDLWHLEPWLKSATMSALTHAEQCYGDHSVTSDCLTLPRKTLPMTIDRAAPCPFNSSICLSNTSNIKIDTGHMDSHYDLGINAPPRDRFTLRTAAHCAPIKTRGYMTLRNTSDLKRGSHEENYLYQEYRYENNNTLNFALDKESTVIAGTRGHDYDLISYFTLDPILELQSEDISPSFFFLFGTRVTFLNPVDDPWFSAHQPCQVTLVENRPGIDDAKQWAEAWLKDDFLSVLACTSLRQFCNPNLPADSGCTPPAGFAYTEANSSESISTIWETDNQRAAVRFVSDRFYQGNIADIVNELKAFSLLAQGSAVKGMQAQLPDNQWQLEVQNWFNISMALLQRQVVEQATGPTDPVVAAHSIRPSTSAEWVRCRNQKAKNTNSTSFSVLGLFLTLSIGSLIIVLSLTLEPLIMFIQRRRGIHSYRRLEWIINETLHLQRLAHEELGFGTWHKADESIPITTRGEKLATVDMTEPEHPKLMAAKQRPGQQTSSSANNSMEVTQETASRPPAPLSYNSPPSSGTETLREETDPDASATPDSPPPTHQVHDHTPPNVHPTVSMINGGPNMEA